MFRKDPRQVGFRQKYRIIPTYESMSSTDLLKGGNLMTVLREIGKFLRDTGMAPTRFGREAVRDPRLVLDMRNGREPTLRMAQRIEHFMNIRRNGLQSQ